MQNLITKKLKISLFTTQLEFINQDEKQADESAAGFVMVTQKRTTRRSHQEPGVLFATRRFCTLRA